jgi:hypothetical protein
MQRDCAKQSPPDFSSLRCIGTKPGKLKSPVNVNPIGGMLTMQRNLNGALLALVLAVSTVAPSLARGNDFIIKDGFGEEVQVRNGFFGRKTKVVKDRLGNGYASKSGLFGTKEQDVNVLGNSFQRKKGILGGSDISGSTIFGDKVQTKKGIFGRRTTTIDASGISSVARGLWNKNKDCIMGTTPHPPVNNNFNDPINRQSSVLPPSNDGADLGSAGQQQ